MTLDHLWHKGCQFLGTKYAILGGAMTWVSEPTLVAAISNAGGFGVLASGAMPASLLRDEIRATRQKTQKPFGVNLITLHPDHNGLVDVCIEEKISHIVLAGGLPSTTTIKKIKDAGIRVICFAPSHGIARKLLRDGADALVLEGMEAGGHIGPVSTSVLVQEILPHVKEAPVFIAGGIGRGEAIVAYLEMGAAGCQLGTRFVCAHESRAHPNFKKAFVRASARDAVLSPQLDERFPVIPVRALNNQGTKEFLEVQRSIIKDYEDGKITLKEGQLSIEHYWAGALRKAVIDGDIEKGSLMAGQSVGMVEKEQSVQEIIQELIDQAHSVLSLRQNKKTGSL